MSPELESGFYWVKVEHGGLTIGHFHSGSWQLPGLERLLKPMHVEVVSSRIEYPASDKARRILDAVLAEVTAEALEGENAELSFDRDVLLARIEAIVGSDHG